MGSAICPAALQLLLSPLLLESPRWLVLRNNGVEAKRVLKHLRGRREVHFDIDVLLEQNHKEASQRMSIARYTASSLISFSVSGHFHSSLYFVCLMESCRSHTY